jgi:uncharacterized protein YndB with AHSA1/START domain
VKKFLLFGCGGALLFAALIVGVLWSLGASTPREHVVTQSMVFEASPETIWGLLARPETFVDWRRDVTHAEYVAPRDGLRCIRESSVGGDLVYVYEVFDPPKRLVSRIVDRDDFGGSWTTMLEAVEGGTRVTITEDGFIDNPALRYLMIKFFGLEVTIEIFFEDLEMAVRELNAISTTPEIAD